MKDESFVVVFVGAALGRGEFMVIYKLVIESIVLKLTEYWLGLEGPKKGVNYDLPHWRLKGRFVFFCFLECSTSPINKEHVSLFCDSSRDLV